MVPNCVVGRAVVFAPAAAGAVMRSRLNVGF
jgi:hypothetical protein